jgi:adenylate cyclase
VIAVLREYHEGLGAIIFRFEGTLERFVGDGLMVLFNDPMPCPDPAHRAVKMSIAMQAAVGAMAERWRRNGHELGFGVGIAHGYATLGRIGFEGRFDYTAIGTVVNLSARLCGEAKAGQILIDRRVATMVDDLIVATPAGELTLKGLHRPIAAFSVASLK